MTELLKGHYSGLVKYNIGFLFFQRDTSEKTKRILFPDPPFFSRADF